MKRDGFTLAEVLITLGIIGVVAALTIPTLLQDKAEKELVTALKKSYSTLNTAYKIAVQENGPPDGWDKTMSNAVNDSDVFMNMLKPYLKVASSCNAGEVCNYQDIVHTHDTNNSHLFTGSSFSRAFLADGSFIHSSASLTNGKLSCPGDAGGGPALKTRCSIEFGIDVNGYKPPNVIGKDYFLFHVTKEGIVPRGTAAEYNGDAFTYGCMNASYPAYCSAWVIYNENIDYLKCKDLSWSGKTKCK